MVVGEIGRQRARAPPTRPRRPARRAGRSRRRCGSCRPSRTLAIGPPSSASGVRWIAAGILPEAPDIRPSVSRATLKPLSCSTPRAGVILCSSGMPLALGPWKRINGHEVAVQLAALEGVGELVLVVEHQGRRLDDVPLGLDRRDLDHRPAEIALEQLEPARGAERLGRSAPARARPGSRPHRGRQTSRSPSRNGSSR